MKLIKLIKNWYHRKFPLGNSLDSAPEIHITEEDHIVVRVGQDCCRIGVDAARPGGDTHSVEVLLRESSGENHTSIEIPVLNTFRESYGLFKKFVCDGSCNNNSDVCAHVFVFGCPRCKSPIHALGEEMEMFAIAGDDSVCMTCFEVEILEGDAA